MATPERVSLELPIAGIGSRTGAYLVDAAAIFFFWLTCYFVFSFAVPDLELFYSGLSGLVRTLALLGLFATQWIYWTASEVLWNGQTFGKRVAGIRVVREDGSPVGFFESAVRNLLRMVDFLPAFYAVGVLCMLITKQNRRLGDIAAGTLLVRTEKISLDRYAWKDPGAHASSHALTAQETELVLSFLERANALAPEARQRLASGFIERLGGALPLEERTRIAASWEASERFLRERVAPGA